MIFRPYHYFQTVVFVALGLFLSLFIVRETKLYAAHESLDDHTPHPVPSSYEVFWRTSFRDRNLSSASQVGFVNNLNDGVAWGLFPLFFAAAGMDIRQIGVLAAIYPATWGIVQLATGALSDRIGRKWLIVSGMWVQAVGIGIVIVSSSFGRFASALALIGIGTAMVYPTLLSAVGDVVSASWRASSVGVYRLWRDIGYAVGALLAGLVADALGLSAATWSVAILTFLSLRMTETLHPENNLISERSTSAWLPPAR